MREPSTEQLEQDHGYLEDAGQWCVNLIDLITDEDLRLELSGYRHTSTLARLEALSDAIHQRRTEISEQLEARSNQAFDRFIQKQRKQ